MNLAGNDFPGKKEKKIMKVSVFVLQISDRL